MTALVFVDTKVFVYSRDARHTSKQQRAHEWMEFLWDTKRGRANPQMDCGFVLSEDMGAGQEIEGMRVVDPFRTPPGGLDR